MLESLHNKNLLVLYSLTFYLLLQRFLDWVIPGYRSRLREMIRHRAAAFEDVMSKGHRRREPDDLYKEISSSRYGVQQARALLMKANPLLDYRVCMSPDGKLLTKSEILHAYLLF